MSMESEEKIIGENLRKLRGDISQEQLAVALRAFGYPWNKMTVYNIERGARQLRLSEAKAVLIALDVNISTGLVSLFDSGNSYLVGPVINQLERDQEKLEKGAVAFYHSRETLESLKRSFSNRDDSTSKGMLQQIEYALSNSDYAYITARIRMIFGGQSDDMGVVAVSPDDEPTRS